MSVTVARRWFQEVWNERRTDALHELADPDILYHFQWGDMKGLATFNSMHLEFVSAMPDLMFETEEIVQAGEGNVITRWMMRGIHSRKGLGCLPTNQKIQLRGITWMKIQNSKVIESWDAWNFDGLMNLLSGQMRGRM